MRWMMAVLMAGCCALAHAAGPQRDNAKAVESMEDKDSCVADAACYALGKLHPVLDEHSVGLRALMAVTPFGALLIPRNWFFKDAERPAFKGSVRRTSLLHGCGPCGCAAALPCTGVCLGPLGAFCGTVSGPLLLGLVLGVVGFVVIPVGGTLLGLCGGGLLGAPVGLVLGSILGVTVGPMLAMCVGCVPLTLWQLWIAPTSVMHAYNQALDLTPPAAAPGKDTPVKALPDAPGEAAPMPSRAPEPPVALEPAPPPSPPPEPSDEGTTIK